MEQPTISDIMYLHDLLEMCQFGVFWSQIAQRKELVCILTLKGQSIYI